MQTPNSLNFGLSPPATHASGGPARQQAAKPHGASPVDPAGLTALSDMAPSAFAIALAQQSAEPTPAGAGVTPGPVADPASPETELPAGPTRSLRKPKPTPAAKPDQQEPERQTLPVPPMPVALAPLSATGDGPAPAAPEPVADSGGQVALAHLMASVSMARRGDAAPGSAAPAAADPPLAAWAAAAPEGRQILPAPMPEMAGDAAPVGAVAAALPPALAVAELVPAWPVSGAASVAEVPIRPAPVAQAAPPATVDLDALPATPAQPDAPARPTAAATPALPARWVGEAVPAAAPAEADVAPTVAPQPVRSPGVTPPAAEWAGAAGQRMDVDRAVPAAPVRVDLGALPATPAQPDAPARPAVAAIPALPVRRAGEAVPAAAPAEADVAPTVAPQPVRSTGVTPAAVDRAAAGGRRLDADHAVPAVPATAVATPDADAPAVVRAAGSPLAMAPPAAVDRPATPAAAAPASAEQPGSVVLDPSAPADPTPQRLPPALADGLVAWLQPSEPAQRRAPGVPGAAADGLVLASPLALAPPLEGGPRGLALATSPGQASAEASLPQPVVIATLSLAAPLPRGEWTLNLQTPEWGTVGLSLRTDGQGGAVVVVQAASDAAQQALSQRSPDLVETMQALGLTAQVDVRQGPSGGGAAGGGGQMPQPQRPPPPQDSPDGAMPAAAAAAQAAASPAPRGSALNFYA